MVQAYLSVDYDNTPISLKILDKYTGVNLPENILAASNSGKLSPEPVKVIQRIRSTRNFFRLPFFYFVCCSFE